MDMEDLPSDFEPNTVTNSWGATLEETRSVSRKLDKLLSPSDDGYESTSEADMATVALLLLWGFNEDDIADILRACRPREKLNRDDYVRRTITNTALTETAPVDPDLGWAWIESVKQNDVERPTFSEFTLLQLRYALEDEGGEATVAQLTDSVFVDWMGSKRDSVMKRLRRALKWLETAGYVTSVDNGAIIWRDDGLTSLTLPHDPKYNL